MAAIHVLRSLLRDDQLGNDELQDLVADDSGASLVAYIRYRSLQADPIIPTVAELRTAVTQLAKQGYAEHSICIRLGKLAGGTGFTQPSVKQVPGNTAPSAPLSTSTFPALASTVHPQHAEPSAITRTSSWTASLAAAACPTPSSSAISASSPAPLRASLGTAPMATSGGAIGGCKLQGAWAQGPIAAMSQKKQAALDERIRGGRTPPVSLSAAGPWAAASPAASVGSADSTHVAGGGRGGRSGAHRQPVTLATSSLVQGHGRNCASDWPISGSSGPANGAWDNGLHIASGRGGCSATEFPPDDRQHPGEARIGPPQGHGHGHGQQGQASQQSQQSQSRSKRIIPMQVKQSQQQQSQQQQQAVIPWQGGSHAHPVPAPGRTVLQAVSPMLSTSVTNPWGVPPVHTSKDRHQQPVLAPPVAAAAAGATAAAVGRAIGETAAAVAAPLNTADTDPSTPCNALVPSCLPGPNSGTTPSGFAMVLNTNNDINDPITPAAQIVPAVSDGSLSLLETAVASSSRTAFVSPPSITSYSHGRLPVGPPRPGAEVLGRPPQQMEEGFGGSNLRAPNAVGGRSQHSGVGRSDWWVPSGGLQPGSLEVAPAASLDPIGGVGRDRLASLHAWVLCSGFVSCLQDEVSELLYLLACPAELLLAATGGDIADTAAAADANIICTKSLSAVATGAEMAQGPGLLAPANNAPDQITWPLHIAVQYGCAVLSRCGGLLSGLGHRLLAAMASCAAARLTAPALAAAADAAAQRRERSLVRSRAVDALEGQRLQLVGPMLQTGNDMASGKSRSQEQQRRVSNRERCRDIFFAVVRQTTSLLSRGCDSGEPQEPSAAAASAAGGGVVGRTLGTVTSAANALLGRTPSPLGIAAALGASGSGSIAEFLIPLRSQCLEVLQALHPDNLPFFAELFTRCVLQAAATGESLVEGDLANLASRNPSKFQRLNQRMQQSPGQVLVQHSAHQQQHHHHQLTPAHSGARYSRTSAGYVDGGLGASSGRGHSGGTPGLHNGTSSYGGFSHRGGNGSMPTGNMHGGGGYGSMAAGGGGTYGSDGCGGGGGGGGSQARDTFGLTARCAATLQRMSYFPPPQRPYIFFLEATDSLSLVSAISRHMAMMLQTMLLKTLGVSQSGAQSAVGGHCAHSAHTDVTVSIGWSPAAAAASVGGPLGDHVVASGTLASYLAYLSVVHGAVRYNIALPELARNRDSTGGGQRDYSSINGKLTYPQGLRIPCHPPLDILQLLHVAEERGVLVHVVPCIAQYLYVTMNGSRLAAGSDIAQPPQQAEGGGDAACRGSTFDVTAVHLPYLHAVASRLRSLLSSRALQPQQASFCAAALCLRSAAEEALSYTMAAIEVAEEAEAAAEATAGGSISTRVSSADLYNCELCHSPQRLQRGSVVGDGEVESDCRIRGGDAVEWESRLSQSLQESDGLIDARMLELCCPAIEAASRVLQRAAAAAAKLLQYNHAAEGGGGAAAAATAAGSPGAAGTEPRPLMPRRVPPAPLVRLGGVGTGMGGVAGAATIPDIVTAALSAPGPSPLQQALAQALLGQYSTGEHAVPMRDVVSYVTGVLAVNGAAAALEVIVPKVASEQLVRLAAAVRPVLHDLVRRWLEDATTKNMPVAAGGPEHGDDDSATLMSVLAPPQLPVSEALVATARLADDAISAAMATSLEAALPAVRRQLRENALRSLRALLPGTVPEEAVTAAASLAAQSAEVACLQRLVAHVPTAVRSHMDEQIKHVVREVVREVERHETEARRLLQPQAVLATVSCVGSKDKRRIGAFGLEGSQAVAGDEASEAAACDASCNEGTNGHRICDEVVTAASQLPPQSDRLLTAAASASYAVVSTASDAAWRCGGSGEDPSSCFRSETTGGDGTAGAEEDARKVGYRLSALLRELAHRPTDPPLDEVLALTARCVGQSVVGVVHRATADGGSVSSAAAAAARYLYDAIRGSELDAPSLERLLVRCLRAGCATACSAGRLATAAWGARPPPSTPPPTAAVLEVAVFGSLAVATGAELRPGLEEKYKLGSGAHVLAFLAEVALGIVQRNAEDSYSWVDVVWQPLPGASLECYDEQHNDGCLSVEREVGSGSCPAESPRLQAVTAAASAMSARSVALPPMLANLYHHLAAYARDMESYHMLRELRLALQRVTMGHLVPLQVGVTNGVRTRE